MRIYTRGFVVRNMGKEDWTITAAAVSGSRVLESNYANPVKFLTLVYLFTLIAGSKGFKFGFSGSSLTLAEMKSNLKMVLAAIILYKTTVTLIKISILMIYLRFGRQSSLTATLFRLINLQSCVETLQAHLSRHNLPFGNLPIHCHLRRRRPMPTSAQTLGFRRHC